MVCDTVRFALPAEPNASCIWMSANENTSSSASFRGIPPRYFHKVAVPKRQTWSQSTGSQEYCPKSRSPDPTRPLRLECPLVDFVTISLAHTM